MQPASQSHSTHGCRPAGRTTLGSALAALVFLGASLAQGVAEAQIPPTVSAPPRLTLFGPLPGNPSPPDEDAKDTTVFLCAPEEICIPLHGEDDEGDHISLSLILPTGFVPLASSDSSLDTTHCFTPDTAGVYCFVFELDDDDTGNGMIESDDDVDSVCVTVVFNDPPTITCPPNVTLQCGSSTDPLSTGFATAEITCSQPASCACNGGIRLLSLQTALPYAGGVISIEARAAKNGMLDSSPYGVDTEVFDGTLFTSATFTGAVAITRMEAVGTDVVVTYTVDVGLIALTKMASNSEFRVTAPSATNEQPIHTSCSQPIAPPFDFGAFSIVGLIDKGGSECNLDSTNCICVIDSITYSDSVTPGACPQEFTIVRTWTAFDSGGNQASCDQTISVADTTSPTITCPEDVTLECNAGGNTGTASATDNCDPAPVISFSDVITVGACPGDSVITRTWNATDACGNSELCVQTITISDTTPPSITCPADVTLECGAGGATGSATATDNCDANPSVFSADSVVAGACPG
ncbi:MAG: hypothetical protein ACE5GA_00915, partial [Candidatus Zixiibacteriota bacterium]